MMDWTCYRRVRKRAGDDGLHDDSHHAPTSYCTLVDLRDKNDDDEEVHPWHDDFERNLIEAFVYRHDVLEDIQRLR